MLAFSQLLDVLEQVPIQPVRIDDPLGQRFQSCGPLGVGHLRSLGHQAQFGVRTLRVVQGIGRGDAQDSVTPPILSMRSRADARTGAGDPKGVNQRQPLAEYSISARRLNDGAVQWRHRQPSAFTEGIRPDRGKLVGRHDVAGERLRCPGSRKPLGRSFERRWEHVSQAIDQELLELAQVDPAQMLVDEPTDPEPLDRTVHDAARGEPARRRRWRR